jgi:peptidoglycan-associated lipoprotein
MRSSVWVPTLVATSLVVACAEQEQPPAVAANQPPPIVEEQPPAPPAPDLSKDADRSQVRISKEIRDACGIPAPKAFFEFDKANVQPDALSIMRQLAECFTTGKLKGERMTLVGRADPRGDFDYNLVLGEKRAANVEKAIAAEGLTDDRMDRSSRGEMDAQGTDEASWALDRRVDIALAR